jgi:predicted dehydrogenase
MAVGERSIGIGVIGCGHVSGVYLKNLGAFRATRVVACADLDLGHARAKAAEFDVPKACSVAELLDDPGVEVVLDLTAATAHASVCMAAVQAGKHVFAEKPLCTTREEGRAILECAEQHNVRVGAVPETFLGGAHQTCRKLIDEGAIGEPVGAAGFWLSHGHESWHPNPEFLYKAGGGPMIDMGIYCLTALVNLLGPIRAVTGMARITFPERTITSTPKAGQKIAVEVPTHSAGLIEFGCGAIGTLVTSFDVWATELPPLEIYGTEGSLTVPEPSGFGGRVRVRRKGEADWRDVPARHGFTENSRGIGVAEMAEAILAGRPHRASGALAYHVLDAVQGFQDAAASGSRYELQSTVDRPAPLPAGLPAVRLDA